jgi:hypothetical protein
MIGWGPIRAAYIPGSGLPLYPGSLQPPTAYRQDLLYLPTNGRLGQHAVLTLPIVSLANGPTDQRINPRCLFLVN